MGKITCAAFVLSGTGMGMLLGMNRSIEYIAKTIEALLGERPGSACLQEENREDYAAYLKANSPAGEQLEEQRLQKGKGGPVFAVCITGEDEKKKKHTAASLEQQTYSGWKTISDPEAECWDYIIYMRGGDTLAPDALHEFASAAAGHDLIYCDEDEIRGGKRCAPFFKWKLSHYTQLSFDMLGSGTAVERKLFERTGGLQSSRYAYNLSCSGHAQSPVHISRVLYTCGEREETGFSSLADVQGAAYRGETALPGMWRGSFVCEADGKGARCGIIVLCQDDCDGLMRLLAAADRSLLPKKTEIILCDMGSTDSRTLRYLDILGKNRAARVLRTGRISVPAALNRAMERADCEAAAIMHSSVEPLSPNWLADMLGQVMRRGVAAAGPKMIDCGGRLLHTGTVVGIGGWEGSAYRGADDGGRDMRKLMFSETLRQVSGLSSRCMVVKAESFFDAGGFDESFEEAGFDTEFCIRLYRKGLACIYVPASLVRCCSKIKNLALASDNDRTRSYDAMRGMLAEGDPFYSPNFDYAMSVPRAAEKPYPPIYLNEKYNK